MEIVLIAAVIIGFAVYRLTVSGREVGGLTTGYTQPVERRHEIDLLVAVYDDTAQTLPPPPHVPTVPVCTPSRDCALTGANTPALGAGANRALPEWTNGEPIESGVRFDKEGAVIGEWKYIEH